MTLQSSTEASFPRRGEIWLCKQNPIMPGDPHLPRPVVIMSTNARNRAWSSVIVVPLSTGLQNINENFHKRVPAGEGGLDRDSHARCDLVSNLDKSCLDNSRGALGAQVSDRLLGEIVRGIRACIGDNPNL